MLRCRLLRHDEGLNENAGRSDSRHGKESFHVEFCTVAIWNRNGEITEERLLYQIGLMRLETPRPPSPV